MYDLNVKNEEVCTGLEMLRQHVCRQIKHFE